MKTKDYLDAIRAKYSISDYKAAELIGISRSAVSRWRQDKGNADEITCLRIAELLEIPVDPILADMRAEMTKDDRVRQVWHQIADRLRKAAAVISAIALLSFLSFDDNSTAYAESAHVVAITNIGHLVQSFQPCSSADKVKYINNLKTKINVSSKFCTPGIAVRRNIATRQIPLNKSNPVFGSYDVADCKHPVRPPGCAFHGNRLLSGVFSNWHGCRYSIASRKRVYERKLELEEYL